ncbi:flavin reductase family protein [Glycomyces buryatensis]|uniref:flavin reductase family protein n=1 Tax=Glycomyces buryatensis TaxID=2570927 RepID=UPI0014562CC0|nr:flavin reductase family protein [Glycomyces buryatensis]
MTDTTETLENGHAIRSALTQLPRSVAVVSCSHRDVVNGLTVSTLSCPTYEPPRLAASIRRGSSTLASIKLAEMFDVHLLRDDQLDIADDCAGDAPSMHRALKAIYSATEADYLARFRCSFESVTPVGDYELIIGLITDASVGVGQPLLRYGKRFVGVGSSIIE